MSVRKGSISVKTNDIFPIIKKWLYSEHDIFIRELVSNACDAITKRSTFARAQGHETPEGLVSIVVDKPNRQITISYNGVGMTEQEVEKYIAQLAFSGAPHTRSSPDAEETKANEANVLIPNFPSDERTRLW
jgi:molecular chaperone HtpG